MADRAITRASSLRTAKSYADLPIEVLVHIFSYLDWPNRKLVRLQCRRWLEATRHPRFLKQLQVKVADMPFAAAAPTLADMVANGFTWMNIHFERVSFDNTEHHFFFRHFGTIIRSVEFIYCELPFRQLLQILCHLTRLQSLTINNNSWPQDDFPQDLREPLQVALANVETLELVFDHFGLSSSCCVMLVGIMPKLRALCCGPILSHEEIGSVLNQPGRHNLRLVRLVRLSVSIDIAALRFELPNFTVEQIHYADSRLTDVTMKVPESKQFVTRWYRNNRGGLVFLKTPFIPCITFERCYYVDYSILVLLIKFTPKNLTVTDCRNASTAGIRYAIAHRAIALRTLTLEGLTLDNETIEAIAKTQPKLQVLNIRRCPGLAQCALRHICEHLTQLTELDMRGSLTKVKAHRKEAYVGKSFAVSQHIRSLCFAGCVGLTWLPLPPTIRYTELRKLVLTDCKRIRSDHFEKVSKMCPSIAVLSLERCSVHDTAVKHIATNLRNVRFLFLDECVRLTDQSLHQIANHCHRLEELSLVGCKNIVSNPATLLNGLPLLKKIRH